MVLTGLPVQNRPWVDAERVGGLFLGEAEFQAPLLDVFTDGFGLFGIVLWLPTFKPNAGQWQEGNAAMRVDRRDELEPNRKLTSSSIS